MKRKIPWLIGLSVVTGLAGSLLVKKNQPTHSETGNFIGTWHYRSPHNQRIIQVTVTPDYRLEINGRAASDTVVELNPDRLVFLDTMGYHLIFQQQDETLLFYDETEDRSFPLFPADSC